MVDIQRITELTTKYRQGTLSATEEVELEAWLNASESNRHNFEERLRENTTLEGLAIFQEGSEIEESEMSRLEFLSGEKSDLKKATVYRRLSSRWAYAATIAAATMLLAGSLLYLLKPGSKRMPPDLTAGRQATDITPGSIKAILTLADGSSILLDSTKNGVLPNQGNTRVLKVPNGGLTYTVQSDTKGPMTYNTITVPVGGQYQVVLPDQSKIWLNSNSSLRFPTAFSGPDRTVELTGEAYMEIAKNTAKPFRVNVHDMMVTALGTAYNIMAYPEEKKMKATLLEGSIRVNLGATAAILTPGEQVQVDTHLKVIKNIDTDAVIAWKNGFFQFDNADIKTVMRMIARWYDVEVKYEGNPVDYQIAGLVSRHNNVSVVLHILELSGFKFKVNGKTITVLPPAK